MKQLFKKEKTALAHRLFRLRGLVEHILQEEFSRHLYQLSSIDELRLFKLITWRDRYHVSIRFILKTLVPYYIEKFKRFSRRNDSLGCKVATLLGRKSESMLRDAISKEYPNNEHIEIFNHDFRLEILAIESEDEDEEFVLQPKSMLHFKTPGAYVRSYRTRVAKKRKSFQKTLENSTRKERQWRGNPFL